MNAIQLFFSKDNKEKPPYGTDRMDGQTGQMYVRKDSGDIICPPHLKWRGAY